MHYDYFVSTVIATCFVHPTLHVYGWVTFIEKVASYIHMVKMNDEVIVVLCSVLETTE